LTDVAVGKKACVSAALTIWVASAGGILAFCIGVTVGRGVSVSKGVVGVVGEVQPAKIATTMTRASTQRMMPPRWAMLLSAYTPIAPSQARSKTLSDRF
jgi:hypothetical protein